MPVRFAVVVMTGTSDLSLSVTLAALSTANRVAAQLLARPPPFVVTLCSPTPGSVLCAGGSRSPPTLPFARARPEVIIVPGLGAATPEEVDSLLARPDVAVTTAWLRRQRHRLVASSCSGVFVLAHAGLLDGVSATTTWWLASTLAARFPAVHVEVDAMVVAQKGRVTAGASLAQLDLMLHLITRLAGPSVAELVGRYLVVEPRPSQARFVVPAYLATQSAEATSAERWIRRHLAEPISVPRLAKALGVSPRTLARRLTRSTGLTPLAFIRHLRLEVARHWLETSSESLEAIAERVGYADVGSLRRVLALGGLRVAELRRPR